MGSALGCVCVPEAKVAMVERFGKFSQEARHGLNCINCFCDSVAGYVSMQVQQIDVRCETKTKDSVFVHIVVSVLYQALSDNVFDAFYKLTDPHAQITAYVYDVVRASVPRITIDDVFLTKDEIAHQMRESLAKLMESYGYEIKDTLITDIQPDSKVKRAMNEINAAERLRMAAADKAEANKIAIVKAAEADAESKYLAGVGVSRQRLAIVEGLRDSVVGFTGNVQGATTKDVMDLILVTQYFDCIKDIGAGCHDTTLYLPHSPGAIQTVADQIKVGFIEVSDRMFDGARQGSKVPAHAGQKPFKLKERKIHPDKQKEREKEDGDKGKEKMGEKNE